MWNGLDDNKEEELTKSELVLPRQDRLCFSNNTFVMKLICMHQPGGCLSCRLATTQLPEIYLQYSGNLKVLVTN